MRYHALLPGKSETTPIELEPLGEGRYAVTYAGRRLEVDARAIGAELSLLIDGASYTAAVSEREESLEVRSGGAALTLSLFDERQHQLRGASSLRDATEGRQVIRSPMPGKVIKLLVKAGDEVAVGQGLVVVEAMKMENELRSPKAGRVVELPALEGATVEAQAVLVVIE